MLEREGGRKFQGWHIARNLKIVSTQPRRGTAVSLYLEGAKVNETATREWQQDPNDHVPSLGTEVLEPN